MRSGKRIWRVNRSNRGWRCGCGYNTTAAVLVQPIKICYKLVFMKRSFIYTVFLCCILTLHARSDEKPYHKFSHEIQLDFIKGMEDPVFSDINRYDFFSPKVHASAGLKNVTGTISSFVDGIYWPLKIPGFSLGLRGCYNMNFLIGNCVENNLVFGSVIRAGKKDVVSVVFDCAYLLKLTDFYKLHNIVLPLVDHTAALSLSVQGAVSKWFLLGIKISSYDMFYYPLFFNPYYEIEGTWLLNSDFQLRGFLGAQYSDMFTLTAYPARFFAGLSLECKIMPSGSR